MGLAHERANATRPAPPPTKSPAPMAARNAPSSRRMQLFWRATPMMRATTPNVHERMPCAVVLVAPKACTANGMARASRMRPIRIPRNVSERRAASALASSIVSR